jgi:hypothetical protein
MVAPVASPGLANWKPLTSAGGETLFAHDRKRTVRYCQCFENFAVVSGREGGLTKLWLVDSFGADGQPEVHSPAIPYVVYSALLPLGSPPSQLSSFSALFHSALLPLSSSQLLFPPFSSSPLFPPPPLSRSLHMRSRCRSRRIQWAPAQTTISRLTDCGSHTLRW